MGFIEDKNGLRYSDTCIDDLGGYDSASLINVLGIRSPDVKRAHTRCVICKREFFLPIGKDRCQDHVDINSIDDLQAQFVEAKTMLEGQLGRSLHDGDIDAYIKEKNKFKTMRRMLLGSGLDDSWLQPNERDETQVLTSWLRNNALDWTYKVVAGKIVKR